MKVFAVYASLIQADANKQRSVPAVIGILPIDIPVDAQKAVRDYLVTLDDAAFGTANKVVPKFISPFHPTAQWICAHRGPAVFAYATNSLINPDNAIIVDIEASPAIRQAEMASARTMIERVKDRFDLHPEHLAGDSA